MVIKHIVLGPELSGDVTLSGGILSVKLDEATAGLTGGLHLDIPLTYFIDAAVVQLGSSPTEQAIAGIIEAALKAIA